MKKEKTGTSVRKNRIKYIAWGITRFVLLMAILIYIAAGIAVLWQINSSCMSGIVTTETVLICISAFLLILFCMVMLYNRLMKFLSFSTLKKIRKDIYCPACGRKHAVHIRAKNPVKDINDRTVGRYIYRWCPCFDRVVNVYTLFGHDDDNEDLQLSALAEDYDRIYR